MSTPDAASRAAHKLAGACLLYGRDTDAAEIIRAEYDPVIREFKQRIANLERAMDESIAAREGSTKQRPT